MNSIDDVRIDSSGRFKYILIKVSKNGEEKYVVRGYAWAEYHADILDHFELNEIKSRGIEFKCVGGGRIQHDTVKKEILVYGHSYGFGRADHEMSVSLIKHKYSNYASIKFSNEGY